MGLLFVEPRAQWLSNFLCLRTAWGACYEYSFSSPLARDSHSFSRFCNETQEYSGWVMDIGHLWIMLEQYCLSLWELSGTIYELSST